jgi:hypothetical protein
METSITPPSTVAPILGRFESNITTGIAIIKKCISQARK